MRLIIKLLLAILLGVGIGFVAPTPVVQLILTFKAFFAQWINFIIPLLIFCFIAEGIANLNYQAGRMLGATAGLAYASTLGAGFLAAFVGLHFIPQFELTTYAFAHGAVPKPLFEIEIPPIMSVMSALLLAFLWGLGVSKTNAVRLRQSLTESKRLIEWVVNKAILPPLPVYIASLFVEMTVAGEVFQVLQTFGFVLLLALILHVFWMLVLYSLAALITQRNVFELFKNMLLAYITAVGTMSSVATIPVTLKQTLKNGVNEDVADFVIPLCATIHLAGSTITLTTAAIAVMLMTQHVMPTWGLLVPFIVVLGVTMVAAPGVPGGAVMAALGLFGSMLGFDETALALMIALYVAQDSFGTACNVTGDGAIALLVNRWMGHRLKSTQECDKLDSAAEAVPLSAQKTTDAVDDQHIPPLT